MSFRQGKVEWFMERYEEKTCTARQQRGRQWDISRAVVFDNVTPHKTAVERSVYCKGAQAWNELPSGVRNIQTYDLFKTYQKHEVLKMTKTLPVT